MREPLDREVNGIGTEQATQRSKDRILIVGGFGALFQGLVHAVEQHFPTFDVALSPGLKRADPPDPRTRLVLIQWTPEQPVRDLAALCREQFPHAATCILLDDDAAADQEQIFEHQLFDGVLLFDLRLDVWLAAMSLLVSGGEYYPTTMMRRLLPRSGDATQRLFRSQMSWNGDASASVIKHLTSRECQVLEFMSQGLQNKLIARRMSLSEHTIKVHVHNIIKKLRVSNRTQAAAAFRTNIDGDTIRQMARGGVVAPRTTTTAP